MSAMQDYYNFWHNTVYGKEFYNTELQILKAHLNNIFGFHLLQIGAFGLNYLTDLDDKFKINHKILLSDTLENVGDNSKHKSILYAHNHEIPLDTHSVDAILISHGLEFCAHPHQLLREVDRILLPEGHLIILGFNPWSWWGLRKSFTFKKPPSMDKTFPWDDTGKWYSSSRVTDWLSLLNYQVNFKKHYFFRPCIDNKNIFKYTKIFDHIGKIIPLGAAGFCIIAVKKQIAFELIRPKWQSEVAFVGKSSYVEPSMRVKQNLN